MPKPRSSTTCCWKSRLSRSRRRRSSCTKRTRSAPAMACTTSGCSAVSTCSRSSSPRATPRQRRVKSMCRRYARTGDLALLAALLMLVACGSSPPATEQGAKPAKVAKADKGATKQEAAAEGAAAAPVEEPLPPQAVQQFDQAVVHMSAGDVATAEREFRALAEAYPSYSGPLLN